MRMLGTVLGMASVLLVTGCGMAKPVMAEGRIKARLTQDTRFGAEDSRIGVTVLSSTMKQVHKDDSGAVPRLTVTDLRKGDLPEGARKGDVIDCAVQVRRKFQSNEWGSPEADDCRVID